MKIIPNRWNSQKLKLIRFDIGETGFSKCACFYATGKDYLVFKDVFPIYSSSFIGNTQRIKMSFNELVYIYSNRERANGIAVIAERF